MFDCNAVIAYCSGGVLSISWLLRVRALPWIRLNERLNNRNLLTFIGFVHSWTENSSSCRGPYSHESASLNIDENEDDNHIENEIVGSRGAQHLFLGTGMVSCTCRHTLTYTCSHLTHVCSVCIKLRCFLLRCCRVHFANAEILSFFLGFLQPTLSKRCYLGTY